jgi:hypothetical protein
MVVGKVLKKPNPFLAIPATAPGERSRWLQYPREELAEGWAAGMGWL